MSFSVVIPARFAATRLPGKPLLDIAGKPMIEHVYRRACESTASDVQIATDDQRIYDAVRQFKGKVCMTSGDHQSGTDRLAEVVQQMAWPDDHIVVNVQGDEPLIPPAVIDQVAENLAQHSEMGMATLAKPITDPALVQDPNCVKVVVANHGEALYFSRAAIPYDRDDKVTQGDSPYLRHIGIYAYRVGLLRQFVQWPVGQLESLEKLEQLRAMENGVRIHVAKAIETIPAGVDTEADLAAIRHLLGD